MLGVSELSRRLLVPKSTVQRLVNTLNGSGLLEQDRATGKYRLGVKLFHLGAQTLRQMDLPRRARPHLQSLTASTGETSTLAVRDGFEALYIERVESPRLVRASSIGSRMPLHCTAVGKVLLATINESEYERFVQMRGLPPRTAHTFTEPLRLKEHLKLVQIQGYAVDNEEFEDGLICVAAAVLDTSSNVIAAIGISTPTTRVSSNNMEALISPVCSTARAISREMGYNAT